MSGEVCKSDDGIAKTGTVALWADLSPKCRPGGGGGRIHVCVSADLA
jgi:hypothetical protein